jgi:hypothetical protein
MPRVFQNLSVGNGATHLYLSWGVSETTRSLTEVRGASAHALRLTKMACTTLDRTTSILQQRND